MKGRAIQVTFSASPDKTSLPEADTVQEYNINFM